MLDRKHVEDLLAKVGYIADPQLAMAIAMMDRLERPLLLEGDAGVGKTQVAISLAEALGRKLIRLQCYEGLDFSNAIYEWNYQRQILAIKILENDDLDAAQKESHIFSEDFLLKRPLLQAILEDEPPVLLIDEVDRADEEFEAYLLEVLSDFQISIPEFGTIKAKTIPYVVLTSNGTRELSDALRRRCLYNFVDYPSEEAELRILKAHYPDIDKVLAGQVVRFIQALRHEDLFKKPGIAETLDWAAALIGLNVTRIESQGKSLHQSLMCVLKTRSDRDAIGPEYAQMIAEKVA
jgi:MoxR-like ATPase